MGALGGHVPHLPADGPDTLAPVGLDDPDRFVRGLLEAVYPEYPVHPEHSVNPENPHGGPSATSDRQRFPRHPDRS